MRYLLGWLIVVLVGCAPLQVGPFVAQGAKVCAADPDCPDHSACRYPSASSRQAVCMTGRESDVYAWSPTAGPGGD
jgi:hypothetical protein